MGDMADGTSGEASFPCPFCHADMKKQDERCGSCGRAPVVAGAYRACGLLGRGGMGAVLAAERTDDGRPAAIKVLWLGQGVDWKAAELFERSTQVLQKLRHRALPEVHAFERDERGTLLLVRDRFDGGSLGERIRNGRPRLDRDGLRNLLEQLLRLLSYLHGQVPPVLHRDIKPDNILFRTPGDWDAVLVDFDSVAAPGPQDKRLTIVCTPGYTAPEQLAGNPSPASDLYSLGATMLFAATGTEPDELPRRDGRFQVDHLLAGLEPRVRQVILRLVQPSLADRTSSAEDALRELAAPEVAAVRVPVTAEAFERMVERHARKARDERAPKHRAPWWRWPAIGLAGAVGLFLLLAAIFPALRFWNASWDEIAHTSEFALFHRDDGDLLVSLEPIRRTRLTGDESRVFRLSRIDAHTGKVLGRTEVGEGQWTILGDGTHVLWLKEHSTCHVQARDPWSGALLTDTADLVRRNPGLAGRLVPDEAASSQCGQLYVPAANGDDLLLRTRDGNVHRMVAGDWRETPVVGEAEELDYYRVGAFIDGRTSSYFQLGTDFWAFEGDDRMRLRYEDHATGGSLDPLPGSQTFLYGGFVCWGIHCDTPVQFEKPDGFLVRYRSGIDQHHNDMLARITREGRTVWTLALLSVVPDLDEFKKIVVLSGRIVVVVQTRVRGGEHDGRYGTCALGLDPASGRVVWTYRP
jgi:serine/threonine protein kinase